MLCKRGCEFSCDHRGELVGEHVCYGVAFGGLFNDPVRCVHCVVGKDGLVGGAMGQFDLFVV